MKLQLIVLICLTVAVVAYKPVAIIHGIMTGAASMQLIEDEIQKVLHCHLCNYH